MDMKLSLILSIYSVILWIDIPSVESGSFKPVYVPYIFQLFGDRPAKVTKNKQTDTKTGSLAEADTIIKKDSSVKTELANLRLRGTGKKIIDRE